MTHVRSFHYTALLTAFALIGNAGASAFDLPLNAPGIPISGDTRGSNGPEVGAFADNIHVARSESSPSQAPSSISGAFSSTAALPAWATRPLSARADGCVNVKDWGAVADLVVDASNNYVSGTDDKAAFQAAIDYAIRLGKDVCVPSGAYYLASGLTIDTSFATVETSARPSLRGSSRGTTWLRYGAGSFSALTYMGGTAGAGPHTYSTISGVRLDKTDVQGIGIDLRTAAFLNFDDITVAGFDKGIQGVDVLSTRFRSVSITSNRIGAQFYRGVFSYPNAITFTDSNIGGNFEIGLLASNPTTLTIRGGEIGSNGCNSVERTRGGVVVLGGPREGGVGYISDGVYYEGNCGQADINIAAGADAGTFTINANTFNRVTSSKFVTSSLVVSGSAQILVDVRGNAFKRFSPYVASANRPYIEVSGMTSSKSVLDFAPTNLMDDAAIEGPRLSSWRNWTPTIGAASGAITTSSITAARYHQIGKSVSWEADFSILSNGSGASALTISLPVMPLSGLKHVFTGQASTGAMLVGTTTTGASTLIFNYSGGYPAADGTRILLSGTYEAQ